MLLLPFFQDSGGLYVIETQNVDGFEEVGPGYKLTQGKDLIKSFLNNAALYKGPKLVYRYIKEKPIGGGNATSESSS